ncbi:hypothetical protein [Treponema pectinovorum]|uniref:hypothetical protein n=1 Tax=Treponema pectinovorum TaxID=164 RepID=UPI003D8B097B
MPEKKNLPQTLLIKKYLQKQEKGVRKNRIQAGTTPGKCCIATFSDKKSHFLMAKTVDKVSSQKVHDAIK